MSNQPSNAGSRDAEATSQKSSQRPIDRARRAGGRAVETLRGDVPALAAGALASLGATVVMGLLRVTIGTLTPPELLGDRILPLLNTGQFIQLLVTFAPHPKTGPLALTLLGQFVAGVLIAPLYTRLAGLHTLPAGSRLPDQRGWLAALGIVAAMELVAALAFWPVLDASVSGEPLEQARLITLLALLLDFGTYGVVLALAAIWLRAAWLPHLGARAAQASGQGDGEPRMSRRDALIAAGASALVFAAGLGIFSRILGSYLAQSASYDGSITPLPTTPITPASEFYVVTKNVIDPRVIASQWRLELTGHVRRARNWTSDELRRLPAEARAITLECISNPVGGRLMSTAIWRGVSLDVLIEAAGGTTPSGTYVIFYGVDDFSTSLPLADLLAARTLLAYEMNGAPLLDRHGFPLRAVVPGRFGEQSAKWVTRIEIADQPYKGLYKSQGWSDAPLPTTSRIDAPGKSVPLGPRVVSGVAFAGTRGIQRVEVSTDGGATWHDATLDPPLSDQTWVLWRWPWLPRWTGLYTLVVRATDGTGIVQTPARRGTVPDGATGWHTVRVRVG